MILRASLLCDIRIVRPRQYSASVVLGTDDSRRGIYMILYLSIYAPVQRLRQACLAQDFNLSCVTTTARVSTRARHVVFIT